MDIKNTYEYSDISATESFYYKIAKEDNYRIMKNYEFLLKIIDTKTPIVNILQKIVSGQDIDKELTIKSYRDSRNYEILRVRNARVIYKGCPWFYPSSFKHMEVPDNEVYPHLYTTINQATSTALAQGGGVNAYTITKDLRLLVLNKYNINKLIKEYLKSLVKGPSNQEYFTKLKTLLVNKYVGTVDISIRENLEISKLIAYLTNALGYDGSFAEDNTFLYKKNEYMINTSVLVQRQSTDKYDWEQWNVHSDFLLSIDIFNLNIKYYLQQNIGFIIYNFYRKMLLPSIKIDDKFDFGTLNVNMFHSINSKDTIENCIKAIVDIIKEYNLKFICLEQIDPDYITELNNLAEAEHLFITDKRPSKVSSSNCIISTCKVDILETTMLPDSGYYLIFKHPHFDNKRILITDLSENKGSKTKQLNILKAANADIIFGDISINQYNDKDYKYLSSMGYILNDVYMESTTPCNGTVDYIMTKLPEALSTCTTVNYKYSDHRLVLGKY